MQPMNSTLGEVLCPTRDSRRSFAVTAITVTLTLYFGFYINAQATNQTTLPTTCSSPASHSLDVTTFGAKGDRTTDNAGPLALAFDYATRCHIQVIRLPAGTYFFTPIGPTAGILVPSNISLVGDGIDKTILVVSPQNPTGSYASFLWARNQDNIEIRGITFRGNNTVISDRSGHPLNSYGTAISIVSDEKTWSSPTGTPRRLAHFRVVDSKFENFNGIAWLSVRNYNADFPIDDIEISNDQFVSFEGNAVNPDNIGYPSNAISITGSLTSAHGLVTNVRIAGNTIDATHIKGGIAIWSGVRDVSISHNSIANAGADRSIPNDRGAYAITVYNSAYYHDSSHAYGAPMGGVPPDNVSIEANIITNPKSCGIYAAAAAHLLISDNDISGQSDPDNHTLPKGAIALNQPLDATVTRNRVSRSHIAMSLYEGKSGHISASKNVVTEIPSGGAVLDPVRPQAHEVD